ncbi:MAG: CRISPR-associated protein Cas4 [Oscillospiraceae bacterium]
METINIRSIQHYMYCPRRFALLEINNDWAENYFVVKANLMHKNVHNGSHTFSDSKKTVVSSVSIYNDMPEYDLYGIADCIEFHKSKKGVEIPGLEGLYAVKIVEYKPKPPKTEPFHQSDAIQVFAQKICADYVFGCDSECFVYYSETKKRVYLPFDEEFEYYDQMLRGYLENMRKILESDSIPARIRGQKCSGCSLSDVCFPKVKKYNMKDTILKMIKDDGI